MKLCTIISTWLLFLVTPAFTRVDQTANNSTSPYGPAPDGLGIIYTQLYAKLLLQAPAVPPSTAIRYRNESLVVHLFLRRTVNTAGIHLLRGFGWAETAGAPDLERNERYVMPYIVHQYQPQLTLHVALENDLLSIPFTMYAEHLLEARNRPFAFHVQLPQNAICFLISEASHPKLFVEICVPHSLDVCNEFTYEAPPGQLAGWNVVPAFRQPGGGTRPEAHQHHARMLAQHVIHHRKMGFAGVIKYTTPRERFWLSKDPLLKEQLDKGWLRLISWDYFKWLTTLRHPSFDQHLSNNHAMLALMDCPGMFLTTLNVDEFFMTWAPGVHSVQAAIDGCFPKGGSLFQLLRNDIQMSSVVSEHKMWMQGDASCSPLHLYDQILLNSKQFDMGKPLVTSNSGEVYGFLVHEGITRTVTGGYIIGFNYKEVDASCASIVHLANLNGRRVRFDDASSKPFTNWLYPHGSCNHTTNPT